MVGFSRAEYDVEILWLNVLKATFTSHNINEKYFTAESSPKIGWVANRLDKVIKDRESNTKINYLHWYET